MGQTITVDRTKLLACASAVDGAGKGVESAAGEGVIPALATAEAAVEGSVTAGALPRVGTSLAEVAADLVTAIRGLADGLETAAERFQQVDVLLGEATHSSGTPRNRL
jgi:hypothetical protein